MKYVIPHPDGDRYWPESYLPQPRGAGFYLCPLDATAGDGGPNEQPWDQLDNGCLTTQPHHDPVFLVLFDLHYLEHDLATINGARRRLALLTDIAIHDRRGYIKPQLGSAILGLKNCADLHDWDAFIALLEELEIDLDKITEQVQDEDLAESKARQHDGYIKADTKKGKQLLKKIMGTKESKKK